MRDVPLGTLIFRAGLLAEEQLEDALQEGMRNGKRLGEVLLERGWLHERDLGRLLAGQKGLPFVEVRGSDAEADALQMLPEEKARMQNALPLRHEDGQLVVAVADPSNELVLENLRRTLGSEPRLVVAPQTELIRAIGEAYGGVAVEEPTLAPEPTLAQEPTPAPEPILTQEPTLSQEPTLTQETHPLPEPTLPPEPTLAPEPTFQQEPTFEQAGTLVPEQLTPAPIVAPLPTVVPPMETRSIEPVAAPLLQPAAIEPAAETNEHPSTVEPMTLPAPTPDETPAPLLQSPVSQPEPVVVPEAITPLTPPTVATEPAPVEPLPLVAPLQRVEAVEPQPAPEAPPDPVLTPPVAEHPVESAPVSPGEVVPPAPLVAPVEPPAESTTAIHAVVLRLAGGEVLEIGTFESAAEASTCAQDVVRQITMAEGEAGWPFFGDRYLRPDTIVSIDLIEEQADKWLGSSMRTRWGNE